MRIVALFMVASCIVCAERLTLRVIADTTVTFAARPTKHEAPGVPPNQLVLQGRASFALLEFDISR